MAFPASGGLRYGSARCPPAAPDGGYAAEPRSDRRRFGGFSEKPPEKMGTHHGDKAGDFTKMSNLSGFESEQPVPNYRSHLYTGKTNLTIRDRTRTDARPRAIYMVEAQSAHT